MIGPRQSEQSRIGRSTAKPNAGIKQSGEKKPRLQAARSAASATRALNGCGHRRNSRRAVTVLVFLARSTRAQRVAADVEVRIGVLSDRPTRARFGAR